MPIVLDADALLIVQNKPELVRGYKLAVLTPNVVEFGRLTKALGIEDDGTSETGRVEKLARALGGVTVLQKGKKDFLSDGEKTMVVDWEGGRKRSGGQGDTLTGCVATFLAWRKAYLDGIWDHGGTLKEGELVGLAVFGGSVVTRVSFFFILVQILSGDDGYACFVCVCVCVCVCLVLTVKHHQECSRLAFAKHGRSLQASDLTDEVHNAFMNIFGEVDVDGDEGDETGGAARL